MITRRFLLLIVILTAIFWGLMITGYRVLLFLFLLLLLTAVSTLALYLSGLGKVKITQHLMDPVVERRNQAFLKIDLRNDSRYVFPLVALFCLGQDPYGHKILNRKIILLKPRASQSSEFTIDCPHCGTYTVGLYRAALRDLFGLYYFPLHSRTWWQNNRSTITVIPAWQRTTADWLKPANWPLPGLAASRQVSQEIDTLANLRDYQSGDSMKRIHWKLSARLDQLMTREFEDPTRRFVFFSLNPQRPPNGYPDDCLDWLLETAATSMHAFLEHQRQVKWLDADFDWQIDEADRLDQFDLIRQSICHFSWSEANWTELLSIRLGNQPTDLLVLITWQLDESIRLWLEQFLMEHGRVMLLWLRLEPLDLHSEIGEHWDKLLKLGMLGHIVRVVGES